MSKNPPSRSSLGQFEVAVMAAEFGGGGTDPTKLALDAICTEDGLYSQPITAELAYAYVEQATGNADVDLREAAQSDLFNLARKNPAAQIEIYHALFSLFRQDQKQEILERARNTLIGVIASTTAEDVKKITQEAIVGQSLKAQSVVAELALLRRDFSVAAYAEIDRIQTIAGTPRHPTKSVRDAIEKISCEMRSAHSAYSIGMGQPKPRIF